MPKPQKPTTPTQRAKQRNATQINCNHFDSAESETWMRETTLKMTLTPKGGQKHRHTEKVFEELRQKNRVNRTDDETDISNKWDRRAERRGLLVQSKMSIAIGVNITKNQKMLEYEWSEYGGNGRTDSGIFPYFPYTYVLYIHIQYIQLRAN